MAKKNSENGLRLYYQRGAEKDVATFAGDPSKARVDPSFAQDAQIQNMLKKFTRGEIHPRQPFYADVSDFGDFRQLQERTLYLQGEFDKLPASIRALAENDPGKLAGVISNPANKDFLTKEGFFKQSDAGAREKEPGGSAGTPGAGSGVQPQENEAQASKNDAKASK